MDYSKPILRLIFSFCENNNKKSFLVVLKSLLKSGLATLWWIFHFWHELLKILICTSQNTYPFSNKMLVCNLWLQTQPPFSIHLHWTTRAIVITARASNRIFARGIHTAPFHLCLKETKPNLKSAMNGWLHTQTHACTHTSIDKLRAWSHKHVWKDAHAWGNAKKPWLRFIQLCNGVPLWCPATHQSTHRQSCHAENQEED